MGGAGGAGAVYGRPFAPAGGAGRAVDRVELTELTKSGDAAGGWSLHVCWSGGTAPYRVLASFDAAFERSVWTVGDELDAGCVDLAVAPEDPGMFVNVADGSTVSPAVRGMGYDPLPAPRVTGSSRGSAWWGQDVTLSGSYLAAIAPENVVYMPDLGVKAHAATVPAGSAYATSATFTVPEDARTFWGLVEASGRADLSGTEVIAVKPPGIGPYSGITAVSWAPQTGKVWVAAQGRVEEVELFDQSPAVVWTGSFGRPYMSRVTESGSILVIDRDAPGEIREIDVTTHATGTFAQTSDDGFSRVVGPVGLAVDPDGSVAYVADAGSGRVVRVPRDAGPGSSTITDRWGGRDFIFVDPCGVDVGPGHQVLVANEADGYVWQLWSATDSAPHSTPAGTGVHAIEVDREASGTGWVRYVISNNRGMAEAFNPNDVGGAPRYHGARVYGLDDGRLELDPDWTYWVHFHYPQRVVLSNSGTDFPYPSRYQVADRVVEVVGEGWAGVPVRLRAVDPPDMAAYAPDGGWVDAGDPAAAVPPYEGNDNVGYADPEWGLSTSASGPWSRELQVTPGSDSMYTVYLRLPARYSGDNLQVEVTKCRPDGTVLPQRVVAMSPVYTGWKRIFIERDKMFRKGGVLAEDYVPDPQCGQAGHELCVCMGAPDDPDCCRGIGPVACNQLVAYDWQNAAAGDQVAVFDEVNTFEAAAERRTVSAVSPSDSEGKVVITLDRGLSRLHRRAEPSQSVPVQPTFSDHQSAGYGVVSGCDLATNQLNAADSCFFEADLRGMEKPYADAFVDVLAPRDGTGAVPYVAESWFSSIVLSGIVWFQETWFAHLTGAKLAAWLARSEQDVPRDDIRTSYFHVVGASKRVNSHGDTDLGLSDNDYNFTYFFRLSAEEAGAAQNATPTQIDFLSQHTAVHESGHQFDVNTCSDPSGGHDSRDAWCGDHCKPNVTRTRKCVMGVGAPPNKEDWDGINPFCTEDLFRGDPGCAPDHAIRREPDPVKGES